MTRQEKYRATQRKRRARETRRALRLIRKGQPETYDETIALGLGLSQVGKDEGAFRAAYRIVGTTLLIKFPLQYRCRRLETGGSEVWSDKDGKHHTRMEVKKILALQKFPVIRRHIPPVYYFNSRDGVLVTKYFEKSRRVRESVSRLLGKMVKQYCGVTLGDLTPDNLRAQSNDHLVIIDLGY